MVRARLEMCLGRSEQTEIWLYKDQVIIRDFSRSEYDHFYAGNGGNGLERREQLPESYLSANFWQMFATFLPSFGAILMHSSGLLRNEKAVLFLAPDGGGKTTVLGHSTGEHLLNDDHIVLQSDGEGTLAHGTPLGSMTSGPCKARVGALFILDQGSPFELAPLEPADVVQCLWNAHRNYTFFLPRHLKVRAFEILSQACHQAPVYRMRFPKDHVDWRAIDAAMAT
jgi:hypothetical protein